MNRKAIVVMVIASIFSFAAGQHLLALCAIMTIMSCLVIRRHVDTRCIFFPKEAHINLSSFVSPRISSKSSPRASRIWSKVECRYATYLSTSISFLVAISMGFT